MPCQGHAFAAMFRAYGRYALGVMEVMEGVKRFAVNGRPQAQTARGADTQVPKANRADRADRVRSFALFLLFCDAGFVCGPFGVGVAVHQFDDGHGGHVAIAKPSPKHAPIAPLPFGIARPQHIK